MLTEGMGGGPPSKMITRLPVASTQDPNIAWGCPQKIQKGDLKKARFGTGAHPESHVSLDTSFLGTWVWCVLQKVKNIQCVTADSEVV